MELQIGTWLGLLQFDLHKGVQTCLKDLNHLLRSEEALYINQFSPEGFEWVDLNHRHESVAVYKRKGKKEEDDLLIILNLTSVVRYDWHVEVWSKLYGKEIFNSDAKKYGGTGTIYNPDIRNEVVDKDQKKYKLIVNLPPLSAIILK